MVHIWILLLGNFRGRAVSYWKEWKQILISKFSIKATGLISDLIDADDFGYDDVRDRLLERTAVSTVQARMRVGEEVLWIPTRENRSDIFQSV